MARRLVGSSAIAGTVLVTFPVRVIGLFLQLGLSIFLARLMGPEMFGQYSYALLWAMLVGLVLSLGLEVIAPRQIPFFVEKDDKAGLVGFLRLQIYTLAVTSVLAFAFFGLTDVLGILQLASGWVMAGSFAVIHATGLMLSSSLVGFRYVFTAVFLENIPRGVLLLLLAFGFWTLGFGFAPDFVFWWVTLGSLPTIFILMFFLWRELAQRRLINQRPTFDAWAWYASSIPVAIFAATTFVRDTTDILMVEYFLTDADVGVYRVASRGAFFVGFAIAISVRVLGPYFATAVAQEDDTKIRRILAESAALTFALGLAACAVLWILAATFMGLFGPGFDAGTGSMRILIIGRFAEAMFGSSALVLITYSQERLLLWLNIVALTSNAVLNYFLIQQFGIEGAAIASALTASLAFATMAIIVRRKYALDSSFFSGLRLAVRRMRRLLNNGSD